MEKAKVKIVNIIIGDYDYDSMVVKLNGVKTEICFNKRYNISKYKGKEIFLTYDKGHYSITPIDKINNKK